MGTPGSSTACSHDTSGVGRERNSVGSGPNTTSSDAARSGTFQPIVPLVDSNGHPGGCEPPVGTRPGEGLNPASPHNADGIRRDPPPSLPVASGTIPAATAAA